jgi:hypothetical protein
MVTNGSEVSPMRCRFDVVAVDQMFLRKNATKPSAGTAAPHGCNHSMIQRDSPPMTAVFKWQRSVDAGPPAIELGQ